MLNLSISGSHPSSAAIRSLAGAPWALNACVALVCIMASAASAEPTSSREPVQSLRPLLIAAVGQGEAHGVLVGPAADAIASQFASREPIEVDVTTVGSLPTPGCKRLQVQTRQAQVMDRQRATKPGESGKPLPPKPMLLRYDISFCADGTFPPPAARATASSAAASSSIKPGATR